MANQTQPRRRPAVRQRAAQAVSAGLVVLALVGLPRSGIAATLHTAATPPANTSPPSVTGTAQQGQTLTGTTGPWSGDTPISFAFQWQRCDTTGSICGDIAGATGQTYVLVVADVGGTLRLIVTATNASGSSSAASGPTSVVAPPGSAPALTAQPNPHGTPQVGKTLTVDNGSWSGTGPITYSYQWQRCSSAGAACTNIPGATAASYAVGAADVGSRLRAVVAARNAVGATEAPSNLSDIAVSAPGAPVSMARPSISIAAGAIVGQALAGSIGTWSGNEPIAFAYSWNRCDAAGGNCQTIVGANAPTYMLVPSDAGKKLQFVVTASNTAGRTTAGSALTAAIMTGPAGPIRLPDGRVSIPASSVSLPSRLVISGVAFSPNRVRSRAAITARFRVTDTRGYVVRDALVFVLGLPYNWIRIAAEVPTGSDGYAVIHLFPTANLPLRNGRALVLFVRARRAGESLLTGVSTRRLVQVRLGSPR